VTLGGSAFHARAPATGNARSPCEDRRVAGTTTSVLEAERKSLARINLGHEPEVLREVFRAEEEEEEFIFRTKTKHKDE